MDKRFERRARGGFTIVEMLVVVGILSILVTIATFAASASFRAARGRRADAMLQTLQAGLSTYYAQKGYWPPKGGKLDQLADGNVSGNQNESTTYELSNNEVDVAFREIVSKSISTTPYLDVSHLYVASSSTAGAKYGGVGRDFADAVKKGGRQKRLSVNEMVFGYPESETGHFRRYGIRYNLKTDSITVYKK